MTMSELYVLDNTKTIYDPIKKLASLCRAASQPEVHDGVWSGNILNAIFYISLIFEEEVYSSRFGYHISLSRQTNPGR